MDESTYQRLAGAAFARIEAALEGVEPELVDYDRAGDVLTLTFADGARCVLNTQRPARQIWLAAGASAWHFSFDAAAERWTSDRGDHADLYEKVAEIVAARTGSPLRYDG